MEQTVSATFAELLDAADDGFDRQWIDFFEPDERLSFHVRFPKREDASPPGLLTYISPKPGAAMPESWGAVLDANNLVWVGALESGNEVHVARRIGLALFADAIANRVGVIDSTRRYLTGFSGGGRVASMMIPTYPDRYSGALFICGANPLMGAPEGTVSALQSLPLLFLTGTGDFNLTDTQFAIATFQHAGLSRAELLVIDGLGHELPDGDGLAAALKALV